eukprot:5761437-Pyramimonas_sp.AAC.1
MTFWPCSGVQRGSGPLDAIFDRLGSLLGLAQVILQSSGASYGAPFGQFGGRLELSCGRLRVTRSALLVRLGAHFGTFPAFSDAWRPE